MIHGMKKVVALALALMMTTALWAPSPALGEADFDPGTLFDTLLAEAFEGGRLVEGTAKLQINELVLPGEDAEAKKLIDAVNEMLSGMELRVAGVDDYDQKLYSLSVMMAGDELMNLRVREDAETVRVVSSLLPGVTLSFPVSWLRGLNAQNNGDMAVLTEAYLQYFVVVAAWVSQKQMDNEDLYVYEPVEVDDTDIRDASSMVMRSRIRSGDLKQLVRGLADTFYDDDASQQAIANLLAPLGVTRADLRRFADELPLIISHELDVTDEPTEFTYSYDDDLGVVGFDGVMPALFSPFFFDKGSLTYSKKTNMDDIRHTAHGEIDFGQGATLTGDLQISVGEIIDDSRKDETTLDLVFTLPGYTDPTAKEEIRYTSVTEEFYLAQDGVDIYDSVSKGDIRGVSYGDEIGQHTEVSMHSETKPVGDLDFVRSITVEMETVGVMSMTVQCDIASREYVPVEWADEGKVYDLSALTSEDANQVKAALTYVPMRLALLLFSTLPQELLQSEMGF